MGRRQAVLIATDSYRDPDPRRLTGPSVDVAALADVLADPDIAGFEVTTLVNEPHHVVGEAIGDFYRGHRRDDLGLLYLTGHGCKDAKKLPVTPSPTKLATSPDGRYLYVVVAAGLDALDPQTRTSVVTQLPGASSVVVGSDCRRVYVGADTQLVVLDATTHATVRTDYSSLAQRVAVTPDGRQAYLFRESPNDVEVVELTP